MAICFAGMSVLGLLAQGCAGPSNDGKGGSGGNGSGGKSNSGGSSGAGGSAGSGGSGTGGSSASGGSMEPDAPIASGGSGGSGGSNKGGAGGAVKGGGGGPAGGSAGSSTSDAAVPLDTGPEAFPYMLPPPDQCHDQDYIQGDSYKKTGCIKGDPSSQCGGKCSVFSACDVASTADADATFMCQRDLLFSPEMEQAVKDDGLEGFHYGVVGHDPDTGAIDGNEHSCCQCYQLVYAYPSPNNERQALLNPDNTNSPATAIPVPPPLIVQSFNTAATKTTFDVYMPAGGMGARNGCFPLSDADKSRKFMYTNYPLDGQPGQGGVKPISLWPECRTKDKNWATTASLSTPECIKKTTDACNKITSTIPGLSESDRTNCLKANTFKDKDPAAIGPDNTFYHMNWSVYAMKVVCPEHLTRVTGCKLSSSSGAKQVKKDVKTAAQAAKDPDFWSKSSMGGLYETTTMEDCCRPTCASYTNLVSFKLNTDPQYRAFYSCDVNGIPYTQK
jgi:hypothetical protein